MNLSELLFGKKPPSLEAIRQALADTEQQGKEIVAKLAALAERREHELLNGGHDDVLDRLDDELKGLARQQDRNDVAQVRLREALKQAEQSARQNEADAIFAESEDARQRGLEAVGRYAQLAAELVLILTEIARTEAMITSANVRLNARGDSRHVPGVEAGRWDEPIAQFPPWSLIGWVRLPHPDKVRQFVWPPEGGA
jgi:hypothetical protein